MLLGRVVGQVALLSTTLSAALAAPSGFPSTGNGLWYTSQGTADTEFWSEEWLPVGNGYLAAMLMGGSATEVTQLNIESLWSGGPFQNSSYNGGNKRPDEAAQMAADLAGIRQSIFDSSDGTIGSTESLATTPTNYGSYAGAGYLFSTLDLAGDVTDFFRWLDLDAAVHRTSWTQANSSFFRETFCSHPIQACLQHVNTTDGSTLPATTFAYSLNPESGMPIPAVSCFDNSTLQVTGTAGSPGMMFELLARVDATGQGASVVCTPSGTNATITVTAATAATITWVGGTDYDMDAGDAAHNFSFKGPDPHDALVSLIGPATAQDGGYDAVVQAHINDYANFMNTFQLDLGQTPDLTTPTDQLKSAYQTDVGSPYLEWLTFNLGRYLLAGSGRGTLPANLQGKWGKDSSNPWGADYHANINLQMNYWFAELTGMDVAGPLFNYIEKTWVPRGEYTAQVLYNTSEGFVVHDELNTFGHTGMKTGGSSYADYTGANAWMMLHVWDHYSFASGDNEWFRTQGYPLLKSTALFHLNNLFPDLRFNDSTLIVNPCNSPEQSTITMGCSHAQQLLWMLFNAIEKGFNASGDTDTDFLNRVISVRDQMDKGIHIGSWGQLQEWKVDLDSPTDTHRHLSHLIGLYPGYSVFNYNATHQASPTANYTNDEVIAAVTTSLIHRGDGTGPDADSGWEKVWRAACWAQLKNSTMFYHELTYALERNFGGNLFSLYNPGSPDIFQIDANFGFAAALLNGLVSTPDVASWDDELTIYLLPLSPVPWESGSFTNAHVRLGLAFEVSWTDHGQSLKTATLTAGANTPAGQRVRVMHGGQVLRQLEVQPRMKVALV
ncbi:Six-hairpin glycosidase-like protein [Epithele typhae]|uniref:Six-hairpin glycosidase-like protein n=1 Tax=Epithele typhae TaxID=378194 RepID=UPI002007B782|nr:Six-hairpin glycosidase-like protein [Epithele typhae]KAH9941246.1 Six-hairpin glycosidase-like protein [Epithele typhae]